VSPSFNVEVEFDVYCECGEGLCNISEADDYTRGHPRRVTVGRCPKCHDDSWDSGYNVGYNDGREAYEPDSE